MGTRLKRDIDTALGEKPFGKTQKKCMRLLRIKFVKIDGCLGECFIGRKKCQHFGMGSTRFLVGFYGKDGTVLYHDSTYCRVRIGQKLIFPRFIKGKAHVKFIAHTLSCSLKLEIGLDSTKLIVGVGFLSLFGLDYDTFLIRAFEHAFDFLAAEDLCFDLVTY